MTAAIEDDVDLGDGDRIQHAAYGPGRITKRFGSQCTVDFDDEQRRVIPANELLTLLDTTDEDRDRAFEEANRDHLETVKKARELRILEAARAMLRAERSNPGDLDAAYLTRSQLATLPDPEPLIANVLPRHSYAILRGRDHSFKSFVAIDWACCLATGKPWQQHDVPGPVRVLYIAGEGAHGLRARIDSWEWGWQTKVPDDMLTVRHAALNMHQPGPAFDHLLDHVAAGAYGLVIVDTLRRVSGAADGNGSEMGAVVDNLDRIKQATDRGTVLAVAHTDKGDHDTRGYSGIEDDADVVWAAKRDEMTLTLSLTKMKDGPDGHQITLEAQKGLTSLVLAEGGTARPQINVASEAKILDTLRDMFPDGAASGVLMRATELPESTYHRSKKSLQEKGAILNIGTPTRPHFQLPAITLDSQPLPETDTTSDQANSHDSHHLPHDSHQTPTTPTTLGVGVTRGCESESNPNNHPDHHLDTQDHPA